MQCNWNWIISIQINWIISMQLKSIGNPRQFCPRLYTLFWRLDRESKHGKKIFSKATRLRLDVRGCNKTLQSNSMKVKLTRKVARKEQGKKKWSKQLNETQTFVRKEWIDHQKRKEIPKSYKGQLLTRFTLRKRVKSYLIFMFGHS